MSIALRRADVLPLHRPRLTFAWLPERHRLELVFEGEVTGEDYLGLMRRCFLAHPEAVLADWLYDLRAYRGTVGHADVSVLSAEYHRLAQGRDERTLSVLVTPDPGFVHWAALCRAQFRPRRVEVVPGMAEAEALLAAPIA